MRTRSTAVLLVLFFGGLGALWWARWSGVPTGRERDAMAGLVLPALMKVEPAEIGRIEIEGPEGADRVVLERGQEGRWRVVEPVEALADGVQVEVLIGNLRQLRREAPGSSLDGDPSTYGLDEPDCVVRLYREGEDAPVATLAVGDTLQRLRYVRPGDGPVAMAEATRLEQADQPPEDWRNRALFDIYSYDVKALDVDGPGRDLGLALDDGRWRIVAPYRAPADAQAVDGLLADLATLDAVADGGFAAENVEDFSPYGLDPPAATITVTPAGLTGPTEPQSAFLGASPEGRDDVVYARREGEDDVLLIRKEPVADLGRDPLALRSRAVFDFGPPEVLAVEIETDGRQHRLVRTANGWQVESPATGPADAADVGTLLETLAGLQTAEFLGPDRAEGAGLEMPMATLSVWVMPDEGAADEDEAGAADPFDRPADAALAIGRYDAGSKAVFGRLRDDRSVLVLPETILQVIPDQPLAYRDRTIARTNPAAIRRVEVERDGRRVAVARSAATGPESVWRVVEPLTATADRVVASLLADALAGLRAERLVAEEPESLAPYGLDDPAIRASWTAESGEATERSLLVGEPVPGRKGERYATLDGAPAVFAIGPKLVTLLTTELRERRVIGFRPEELDRVVVRGPEGSVTFRREPGGPWEPGSGDWPAGYGPVVLDRLIKALAALTVERFVQDEGPMPRGIGLTPPARTIELGLRDVDETATIRLGATAGQSRYAALGADGPGAVVLVPAAPLELPAIATDGDLPTDVFAP